MWLTLVELTVDAAIRQWAAALPIGSHGGVLDWKASILACRLLTCGPSPRGKTSTVITRTIVKHAVARTKLLCTPRSCPARFANALPRLRSDRRDPRAVVLTDLLPTVARRRRIQTLRWVAGAHDRIRARDAIPRIPRGERPWCTHGFAVPEKEVVLGRWVAC